MPLTDIAVRQARAADKAYTLSDGRGLGLCVTPSGGKHWHFRYSWSGKQHRMTLGAYPEISLKEARELREAARAQVARGIHPQKHRKQEQLVKRLAEDRRFQGVFEQWLSHRSRTLQPGRQSTLGQIERIFTRDILPTLAKRSIYEITQADLLQVLGKIEAREALTTAEKCRSWLRQLFRFAMVKIPGLEKNPAQDLAIAALPKPPVSHNLFLQIADLPELLQALRSYQGSQEVQMALRLLLMTGVRTGELRRATRDQFDLDQGLWTIPAVHVKQLHAKMHKEGLGPQDIPPYLIPLPTQAREVVRQLIEAMCPAQRYLLTHRSNLKNPISEGTLNQAIKTLGFGGLLTPHGIRGTISTALNEFDYPNTWVAAQLSHVAPKGRRDAYNHAEHVEQRRRMMQDWADRLDLLEQGDVEAASVPARGVPAKPHQSEEAEAVSNVVSVDTGTATVTITISTSQAPNKTPHEAPMTSLSTSASSISVNVG
ncbi:tyrosine-type recombinase/integrase [Candidimonas nitroreducens]|uniref:Integrase n=1 Tax=Candidimonas nitroreducens TaxID=683354 RepID=A0A225M9J9_9BURK|nr:integrase arm-type DNA-binding domain-containing protein [Candidimonas nitroreducens]OWT56943.1 integrase [Candidimonas nitroreducens]